VLEIFRIVGVRSGMEVERIVLFESARDKAAKEYLRSPHDADNLIRWGGVLLELAHFYQGQASINMLQDAVSKFEEALKINPKGHYALWCLGNALTSQNFLFPDMGKVNENFRKAEECYQKALDEDPHNEHYLKGLEMAKKAPSLHKEILKQLTSEQVVVNEAMNIEVRSSQAIKKKKNSDFKYDMLGWVALTVGIIAWVGLARSALQLPLPSLTCT